MRDAMVTTAEVPLAIRDSGGTGHPLLMLHGAGGNLATVTDLVERLRSQHRVIAVDLRGHGRSGDGPWEWDRVLADLDTVVKELDLDAPAIAGASLGGMVAALWAERHPECRGAVSLDGNPPPVRPEQLPGLAHERAVSEVTRLHETFAGMTAAMSQPMGDEQLEAARAGYRAMAAQYASDEAVWLEGLERSLVRQDGMTLLRPHPDTLEQLRRAQESLDLLSAYQRTRCPLLLVQATENMPQQEPFAELYAAYRRGLTERIATAVAANPRLRVVHLPGATHAMAAERPAELAKLITDFLADT
ncbi:alpha/beta fold hydrolase [Streptomyces sp. NPDC001020]